MPVGFPSVDIAEWLEAGKLQRIVLVIMSKATNEVLERWNFNIVTDAEVVEKGCAPTLALILTFAHSRTDPKLPSCVVSWLDCVFL